MDDLTRVLWEHLGKQRLMGCYDLNAQINREDSETVLKKDWEALQDLCSPDILNRLDIVLGELENIRAEDMEAAFVCGLRLGLALR